ncbi:DUF4255 domain-containing protein [Oculatella sp. LEGE 06141]|uniref:DUF4255 domain-containing protein n=1 Tax=Oculatella sp. LEGE 06141 TaxID=1828648 RepID=UPI001881577B|nr:DUF4255 domain-containing protein [Oculatella sp. LEGE 06141]MBE9180872.1 DUF4255 domain-containing protein [Oculatella sp. LEGE 06141]
MSDALAIAAVTATLRNLLTQGLDAIVPGSTVTTQPPDKARNGNNGNQLNLFLYHTGINAAWRNQPIPNSIKPGEIGQPPLPLNLYYMITAYGRDNDDVLGHRLLGGAMSILHDHPLLNPAELKAALPESDVSQQIERVRITPQALSLEEISKLWTTFQTQYRISAAYQLAVVLIESQRSVKAALPVLTRGKEDAGITGQANLIPPIPTLTAITILDKEKQRSGELGDRLILSGYHLEGDSISVQFTHVRQTESVVLSPDADSTATETRVTLLDAPDDPDAGTKWTAGLYTVTVVVTTGEDTRTTNELPFALSPKITNPRPIEIARDGSGNANVTLTCIPQVKPEQRAVLILGDRQILADTHLVATDTLTFRAMAIEPGDYWMRLRIDGAESILINRMASPPVFDDTQQVRIT